MKHQSRIARGARVLTALWAFILLGATARAEGASELLGGGMMDVVEKGGWVMIVILALSVVGVAFTFERLVALRYGVLVPRTLVTELRAALDRGDREAAVARIAEAKGPLARVLAAGVSRRRFGAREMERAMEAVGDHEVAKLKRPVRPIAVLATVEPLLGLLGTILGMISTFNLLHTTSSAERVETLAPGIGQALYTTAAGLCVAIPFVILYHFLLGKVNRAVEAWSLIGTDLALGLDATGASDDREAAA